MQISIFARKRAWHINQLINEARKKQISTNVISLKNPEQYKKIAKKIGDIIIWRSSFLNSADENIIQTSLGGKPLINSSHIKYGSLSKKIFQQKYLAKYKTINCIPTYFFKKTSELQKVIGKELYYPIIKKPNIGAQGEGITLIKSFADIKKSDDSLKDFIFQPFIENDGDFRVLVLGGKVLGIIKRTAKKGGFLNNISQGGVAKHITDQELVRPLSKIALKIASVFELSFCGIDIIFNKKDGRYYFLELNTLPQWKGFQEATKINVAGEIIDYCIALSERKILKTATLVENYFEKSYSFLREERFHYSSRMFLWTKSSLHRKRLLELRDEYLGKSDDELSNNLKKFLLPKKIDEKKRLRQFLRKPYFEKYPQLTAYNKLLFKTLFAETLYGKDLRPMITKHLKKDTFLKLKSKLEKDKPAIAALSTFAVNFIYNLAHYLKDTCPTNPTLFLDIAKENYMGDLAECFDLKLYLLTHAIIGESRFYSRKISQHKKIYMEMIRLCEKIIVENYFAISLDNKFEFLVCAKLLDYKPALERIILAEADRSLSPIGNFLVDRLNDSKEISSQNILDTEHRNVLFVMATSRYNNLPKK